MRSSVRSDLRLSCSRLLRGMQEEARPSASTATGETGGQAARGVRDALQRQHPGPHPTQGRHWCPNMPQGCFPGAFVCVPPVCTVLTSPRPQCCAVLRYPPNSHLMASIIGGDRCASPPERMPTMVGVQSSGRRHGGPAAICTSRRSCSAPGGSSRRQTRSFARRAA